MRTSDGLQAGAVYTRAELRTLFGIKDKTLETGIFRPPGHESIWLFVTEQKGSDMTAYVDRLDGETLFWQGQTAGSKDALIIEHSQSDLELLVFYRKAKTEHPDYGFRFEGQFEYVSHSGSAPTEFVLRRIRNPEPLGMTPGGSHGAACLIDVLASLRQSGRDSVVAEGQVTATQARMHVPDEIERWVGKRITFWAEDGQRSLLVVLSGNAGDGKSDLIERLQSRPDVAAVNVRVIADATHAESPSQSQAERLVAELAAFTSDAAASAEPQCVLVAMNVGMVIAFFDALSGTPDAERFSRLRRVLEGQLGLRPKLVDSPDHWECVVVNLDNRNVLGRDNDGIFFGMLERLDPEREGSLTYESAKHCARCPVRACCWTRTNLNLLRQHDVRVALHELLWEVTLGHDLHLSPRNLWDMLSQVTTGGVELPEIPDSESSQQFLSCQWMRENLAPSPEELPGPAVRLVHRRLLYHLLFEPSDEATPDRGPVLEALRKTDPIRRTGKHTHLLEGEVRAAPRVDSEVLSALALLADEPDADGLRQADPLFAAFANLVTDPVMWFERPENLSDLAFGVSRRARVTGLPEEIRIEVSDPDTPRFLQLLHAYDAWPAEARPPAEVDSFWSIELIGGIGKIFGVDVQGETYFRLDTLSPTTRFPAYVPVRLRERISINPDPVRSRAPSWLDAVAYLPRRLIATINTGGTDPWEVPVDLQLFRLLSSVNRGYSASSVDLEGFFRLRYACERLGGYGDTREIIFRAVGDGRSLRLTREQQLGGWAKTVFGAVDESA